MKAVVVESPNKIAIHEIPDPVLSDYDVLCKTLAAAICGGTDNHIVRNHPYFKVKYPIVLGHEGIGGVIACGPKVKHFKTGDTITRVVNKLPKDSGYNLQYGAFAEKSIATDWQAMRDNGIAEKYWRQHTIHRVLPENFDPIESTMIITWRETYAFLTRMLPRKNNTLLIIGSGANALSFADHGRNMGLKTIVIGGLKRKGQFINAKIQSFIPYQEKNYIKLLKNKLNKIDIIIDTIGKSENLNRVISLLAHKGKIGVYGLDSFLDYSINSSQAPGNFAYYSGECYDEGSAHDDIISYIQKNKLNAWNYLDKKHIYPLDQINQALTATDKRLVLKSVIKFS